MSNSIIHDPKKHPVCAPFYGEQGVAYTRIFKPALIGGLWAETDESGCTLAEHLLQSDEGSPGNPFHGNAQQVAKATRLRLVRSKKCYTAIRKHMECPAFRQALAAPGIQGDGLAALALADNWYGIQGGNLKLENQNSEWQSTKLAQFGINPNSVRLLDQHLQTLNSERPAGQTLCDNAVGARFLACLTFPDSILSDALKEMHTPTLVHPANTQGNDSSGAPLAGQYNLPLLVTTFEAYFRAQIDAGKVRTSDAPKQAKPHTSNRIDGLSAVTKWANIDEADDVEIYFTECHEIDEDGNEIECYEVEFQSSNMSIAEKLCWNCLGSGHTQRDTSKPAGQDWQCPSPRKRRDPKSHMAALAKLATARGGGERPKFKAGRRPTGGPGPKNRFASRPKAAELEVIDDASEEEELSSAEVKLAVRDGTVNPFVSEVLGSLEATGEVDSDFKKAFGIHLNMAEIESTPPSFSKSDEAESTPTPSSTPNGAFAPALAYFAALLTVIYSALGSVAEVGLLATGNLARGPGRLVRALGPGVIFSLTVFMLIAAATGLMVDTNMQVNELGFANNNSFPQMHATVATKHVVPRDKGANPDSGATITASDRRTLFPTAAITDLNPNLFVTVANGVDLPVEFRGAMVIKGRASPFTSSTKKFVPVVIRDAIFVPGLRNNTILISPRNLYRRQGIKTYFNDELHMLLPNGTKVYIAETGTAYMIEVGDWDVTNLSLEAVNTIDCWQQGAATSDWKPQSENGNEAAMVSEVVSPDRIHARCMHASFSRLAASAPYVSGMDLTALSKPGHCNDCDVVKPPMKAHASSTNRYQRFGQCVCSDAIKMPKSTPFGYNGMVDFYDRATGHVAFYFLRTDTNLEMSTTFTLYQLDHREWLPNGVVQLWFFDNHGQFVTGDSEAALAALGTKVRSIVPWNPQMNPAERPWRSVLRPLRICLASHNVSEAFWPFVASQWQFVSNGLATRSNTTTQKGTSPYYMASGGRLANFSFVYEMFCGMSVYVRSKADRNRFGMSKLVTRVNAIHLGIHPSKPALLAYVIDWKRFTCFRVGDCVINEDVRPRLDFITGSMLMPDTVEFQLPSEEQQRAMGICPRQGPLANPVVQLPVALPPAAPPVPPPPPHPLPLPDAVDVDETELSELSAICSRASESNITYPHRDDSEPLLVHDNQPIVGFSLHALFNKSTIELPKNFTQADRLPDAKLWRLSGDEEYKAKFAVNKTGVLVARSEAYKAGKKVIPSKVVFDVKFNDDNSINRRTTRYTACGNWQSADDFSESYTATARATGFRVFLCSVVNKRMHLFKGDVTKAFTQSALDVDMYIEQMDGYVEGGLQGDGRPNKVVYIEKGKGKAIEGLVQSGHIFQTNSNKILAAPAPDGCGLTLSDTEPCISKRVVGNDTLSTYWHIDDSLVGTTAVPLANEFFTAYTKTFPMKPLEPVKDTIFAGVRLVYDEDEGIMHLSQGHILDRACAKFFGGPELIAHRSLPYTYDGKTRASSLDGLRLAQDDEEVAAMKDKPHLSLLMTLLYVAIYTAPHCLHAIVRQGRFMSNPAPYNWKELCNLFSYMYHHRHDGLTIRRYFAIPKVPSARPPFPTDDNTFVRNMGFHVMPDASWKVLRTYAGHAVIVMGIAVDYQSQLIRVICHSTAEAETAAACFAAKRAMYVLQLLRFLGHDIACPIGYLIDCSAVEELSKRNSEPPGEHFLCWFHHFRSKRRPCNRCESCDEVCSEVSLS